MSSHAPLPVSDDPMAAFSPGARTWFAEALGAPTPVQAQGWPVIGEGGHVLLLAPTGSGKTLAAFLYALDRLVSAPRALAVPKAPVARGRAAQRATAPEPGVRVLYVSPLKALVYDVEKNLRAPLAGLQRTAERLGAAALPVVTVGVRTGDTPQKDRSALTRHPPDVLVTTPESLFLMLMSAASETLRTVETVIVDEVHALAGTKRGAHLALSLERLSLLTHRDPQRIGLSATVSPPDAVARYLGGDREVRVVDTLVPPRLALTVEMLEPAVRAPPPPDGSLPDDVLGGSILAMLAAPPTAPPSIWPALERRVRALLEQHRSVIVFVNSRGAAERLARELNEQSGAEVALAHHGSLSRKRREFIEDQLKSGQVRTIVATSSLELGIDMGLVDLVVLIESPGAVSRGLQRVGRAGHGVGQLSQGIMLPKHSGDLLECAVVAEGMLAGAIEAVRVPHNCLDVLAQQLVAQVAVGPTTDAALLAWVRRAYGYSGLGEGPFHATLDMLSGRYPSTEFADLRPKLNWDRATGEVSARRGARLVAVSNAGTIPDRGLYTVHIAPDGPRVGELDEEMVYEARPGQTFVLGASTWRIAEITRDRVLVTPAPGEPGELPFWKGAAPGRPMELGRALGAFVRRWEDTGELPEALDARAKEALARYLEEQRAATRAVPSDRTIVVESFRDEIGDLRVCILSPFGSPVHAPWALALESQLSEAAGLAVSTLWSDDGISLRFALRDDELSATGTRGSGAQRFAPHPAELRERVLAALGGSALFAGLFREAAGRALLLPRRGPDRRTPLWSQRLKAQALLAVARDYPSFPIVLEAYRTALEDLFDLQGLEAVLTGIQRGEVRMVEVSTERPSPFARALVFDYVASWLYEGDAPAAERRAQALTLDRELLRELLGEASLGDLLDPDTVAEQEAELQSLTPTWQARDADGVVDVLRRLGDLSAEELAARCAEGVAPDARAVLIRLPGVGERLIAQEDAGLYRDALGAIPPLGLPAAYLEPRPDALYELISRWSRRHGPFTAQRLAERWGLRPAQVAPALQRLCASGQLSAGRLLGGGADRPLEYCDAQVLRALRRRSLAAARGAMAPVAPEGYARFLLDWHGVDAPRARDAERETLLEAALLRLEGVPLPFGELEQRILPARVPGFRPADLDDWVQSGMMVWAGAGEGRVILARRENAALLLPDPPAAAPEAPLERALVEHLQRRGASFLFELKGAAPPGSALDEVVAALLRLAWEGRVSNDALTPLRASLGGKASGAARAVRSAGGRWSLLPAAPPGRDDTARLHAQALQLVARHGVASRESLELEAPGVGFSALYPVLKALDEVGTVRRGYFVDGLSGQQFTAAGAVDRLRDVRDLPQGEPRVVALAAVDPACPWGAVLPWPSSGARREVGATVVLVDGAPAFWLSRGGRQLLTLAPTRGEPVETLRRLAASHAAHGRFTVERVDEGPVRASPWLDTLLEAGFEADPKGLAWHQGPRGRGR